MPATHLGRRRSRAASAARSVFARLFVESLEARLLLTADPLFDANSSYETVSALWFETLSLPTAQAGGAAANDLGDGADSPFATGGGISQWIVRLKADALATIHNVADAALALNSSTLGLSVVRGLGLPGQLLLEATAAATDVEQYLAGLDVFQYFATNSTITVQATPNDPSYSQLYGLHNIGQTGGTPDRDIDAPEAWDVTTGSRAIIVGIIDTGIDWTHVDLAANIWTNPGEIAGNGVDDDGNGFIDDVHGYDFVNNDGDPMDDHYHGTHVAGTIGAVGNNGIGVVGVNWAVTMIGLKFLDASGNGSSADAIRAINYATMMKSSFGVDIRITNNSWGGGGFEQPLLDSINAGGAAGILFVAAAGNESRNIDSQPAYPASFNSPYILSVAAVDHNDALAWFSNYGATSVDLAAPGVDIYSTSPGNSYRTLSGTSMAAPHAAGAAALALSIDPTLTPPALKNLLMSTVDAVPSLAGIVLTGGRLNAASAINALGLLVIDTTPSAGSILGDLPTSFDVTFSLPYDPASVQAGDFTVNGVAADGFVFANSRTVTFTFSTSPVTTQGVQTMSMAAGAVRRAADGAEVVAFSSTFRYDAVALAPVATTPVDGSAVTLPLTYIDVVFNEAFDVTSVGVDDLTVSQGTVVGATILDAVTVRYVLAGVSLEGTLFFNIAAGALLDVFGNAGTAFAGLLLLDVGVVPFPVPLSAVAPYGSTVYRGSASSAISFADDVDGFTIELEVGGRVTIVVRPSGSTLRPRIELLDPLGNVVAVASAPAAGSEAVLLSVPIATAGTYRINLSGADGTLGGHTLEVLLNAAVESESHGGAANGAFATAQSLEAAFVALGGNAWLAAVLGTSDVAATTLPVETEDNGVPATASYGIANFTPVAADRYQMLLRGTRTPGTDIDFFRLGALDVGDVLTISQVGSPSSRAGLPDAFVYLYRGTPTGLVLVASNDDGGAGTDSLIYRRTVSVADTYYVAASGYADYTGGYELAAYLEKAGAAPLLGGGLLDESEPNNVAGEADDAGAFWRPVAYRSQTSGALTPFGDVDYYAYQFQAGDLITVRSASGGPDTSLRILNESGIVVASEDGSSAGLGASSAIYAYRAPTTGIYFVRVSGSGTGAYTLEVELSTDTPPPTPSPSATDYYSFTMTAGERAWLALSDTPANLLLALYDAQGTLLATGSVGDGFDSQIADFTAATSGTYYVAVTGGLLTGNYNLQVARNVALTGTANNTAAAAQSLTGTVGAVLTGFRSNAGLGRLFAYDAATSLIREIDPQTGAVIRSFASPVGAAWGPDFGLATSPDMLWVGGDIRQPIYGVDPTTGAVLRTIANPGIDVSGLAYRDGELFVRGDASGLITVLSVESGAVLRTFTIVASSEALAAGRDYLYASDGNLLYVIDPQDGATVSVRGLGGVSVFIEGLGVVGDELFVSDQGNIFVYDTTNFALRRTYSGFGDLEAIGADGGGDSARYYRLLVAAGDLVHLRTTTPGDPVGQFVNRFNPLVELFDAGGNLVATNDDGAADGRNASLEYLSAAGGYYLVRVAASPAASASEASGEFVLHYQATPSQPPPQVVGVYVRGAAWSTSFLSYLATQGLGDAAYGLDLSIGAGQTQTLPWQNVNMVSVQFSVPVVIAAESLQLVKADNGPALPELADFAWNATTRTATWTFSAALPRNKYLLHFDETAILAADGALLDGEWTTDVSTGSGNGTAGGDFNFRFNVLPADIDGNRAVGNPEILQARLDAGKGTGSGGYNFRKDLDANGVIGNPEILAARSRAGSSITGLNEPIMPGGSPLTAASLPEWLTVVAEEYVSPFAPLTMAELELVVTEAIARWEGSGLVPDNARPWSELRFTIEDLGGYLGLYDPDGRVRIDDDGAGWGWFVDATPGDDDEYASSDDPAELIAQATGPAADRMDLLTTVMHEIGNFLGYRDVPADQPPAVLMTALFSTGLRRLPTALEEPPPVVAPATSVVSMEYEGPLLSADALTASGVNLIVAAAPSPTVGPIVRPEHAALALWSTSRASHEAGAFVAGRLALRAASTAPSYVPPPGIVGSLSWSTFNSAAEFTATGDADTDAAGRFAAKRAERPSLAWDVDSVADAVRRDLRVV